MDSVNPEAPERDMPDLDLNPETEPEEPEEEQEEPQETLDEPQEEPQEEPEPPKSEDPPQYVTKAEWEAQLQEAQMLRSQLGQVAGVLQGMVQERAKPKEPEKWELDDETWERLLEDKETFQKFLGKFAADTQARTLERMSQDVYLKMVDGATRAVETKMRAQKFFEAHPEIEGDGVYLGQRVNAIMSQNPGVDPVKVLEVEAAKLPHFKALRAEAQAQPTKNPPKLRGTQGGKRPTTTPKLVGLEAEVAEMLSVRD